MINDKLLECAVIGNILNATKEEYFEIIDIIDPDSFYETEYKILFSNIKKAFEKTNKLDLVQISKESNFSYLNTIKIKNEYIDTALIFSRCCKLEELSIRRKLKVLTMQVENNINDLNSDILDIIVELQSKLSSLINRKNKNTQHISEVIEDVVIIINTNLKAKTELIGIPWGFSKIDRHCRGRQKGDLNIIAAETSQGKTSFVLSSINETSKVSKTKTLFITLEMSNPQLVSRLIAQDCDLSGKKILGSKLENNELYTFECGIKNLINQQIWLESSINTLPKIIACIKEQKAKNLIDLVVIDYLQLIRIDSKANKEEQIAFIARELKNLAKEIEISIDLLSQLRRNTGGDPFPTMNRLRDSGQIEEAADNVILIYRPEYYEKNVGGKHEFKDLHHSEFATYNIENRAQIIWAKGRNCGTDDFILCFDSSKTKFYECESLEFQHEKIENTFNEF